MAKKKSTKSTTKRKVKKRPTPKTEKVQGKDVIIQGEPPKPQQVKTGSNDNWDDRYYLSVFEWSKRGYSEKTIASNMGVTVPTFRKWCSEKPALVEALNHGKEQSTAGKWEHLKKDQRAFLIAYTRTGNVAEACRAASIDRKRHYRWLRDEVDVHKERPYTEAFKEAEDEATDTLLAEARRRAVNGVKRMKFHQGIPIMVPCMATDPDAVEHVDKEGNVMYVKPYVEHEYSDTLLIFLLKGLRPDMFREKHTVNVDASQNLSVNLHQLVEELEGDPIVIDADYVRKLADEMDSTSTTTGP